MFEKGEKGYGDVRPGVPGLESRPSTLKLGQAFHGSAVPLVGGLEKLDLLLGEALFLGLVVGPIPSTLGHIRHLKFSFRRT